MMLYATSLMSRGWLRNNFTSWGSHQGRKWVTSGQAETHIGRTWPACGSSRRSLTPKCRGSSLRMLREGNRFWRCFLPLGLEPSLPGMQMLPILRTAGGRFRERIILSGSSRGLSRRRKKSEKFVGGETTKAMTASQKMSRVRCDWAKNELNIAYHDEEWGAPVHDERTWLELLILEGAQAGLSWDTVLKKRARYREVFDGFDPQKVARYDKKKVRELLRDAGIIRNRLKIDATISNARAFLEVQKEFGTFDAYVWRFVGGRPKQNAWKTHKRVPAKTEESDTLSKDLQKRGFRFVGSTICYALMQATGMVNDHLVSCFRYAQLKRSS